MPKNFGEILKELRENSRLTQRELAAKLGLGYSTIAMYESNKREPNFETLEKIADFFNTDMNYLYGKTNIRNRLTEQDNYGILHAITKIPVYAPLCCGDGLFVDDQIIDYVAIPTESLQSHKEYFGQYAKGDSMIGAGINDGDILIFEKINGMIGQGQIGCFCIDENIATCKKMMIAEDSTVYLMPANENYPPITITVENSCFRCIGKLAFVVSDRRGK